MMSELSRSIYKYLSIAAIISIGLGLIAARIVANEPNGYVAGFTWFYLLFLIAIASLVLFIAGLFLLSAKTQIGVSLILSSILFGSSYLVGFFVMKTVGWTRYSNEQMTPIIPEISNLVVFKKDVTHEQIEKFWIEILSTGETDKGHSHRPGIKGIGRMPSIQGYEIVAFSFFPEATKSEREDVYSRVKSSPIVYKLMENVPTSKIERVDDTLRLPTKPIESTETNKSIKGN